MAIAFAVVALILLIAALIALGVWGILRLCGKCEVVKNPSVLPRKVDVPYMGGFM